MKIVLAVEKGDSRGVTEETFSIPVIKIGRDANNCEIFFDNSEFRMVSRHHADIRFTKGRWMVGDMGSSFGTYLNGARLTKPAEILVGSAVQFGEGGPRAHVIWLETDESEPVQNIPDNSPPRVAANPSPPASSQARSPVSVSESPSVAAIPAPSVRGTGIPASNAHPSGETVTARLELQSAAGSQSFEIGSGPFWLGRDPACDIVIEAGAVMVSRRHAMIKREGNDFVLNDNQSFNGTLVNDQRVSSPTPLYGGDSICLGLGGPVLKFAASGQPAPAVPGLIGQRQTPGAGGDPVVGPGTMVFNLPAGGNTSIEATGGHRQLVVQVAFDGRKVLTIGRNDDNDISLDGLQISNRHARLRESGNSVTVEDLNSTNGVYVNGERVSRKTVERGDSVQIGSFVIETDDYGNICVFDSRSKVRIDSVGITKEVRNRAGGGMIRLLDDISLSIRPNEFVGLLGPSGAGKSTFMDALNGMRCPSAGTVYVNGQDLYQYIDSLKQSIGYVPQDEIIHGGLTVAKTLFYIAKLRLSRDVTGSEIDQIIGEVLDVTGLTERRDVAIDELSGGQRKRVSIAVELITKPSIIFLDEPTSGLDPATEEKIMVLFRQIAESGRTVVLTTHAMENVSLFDKIVVLMRGKLVFYGKPSEALKYFDVSSFKALYDKLEEPVEKAVAEQGEEYRFAVTERVADDWRDKYKKTKEYERNVERPLREISESGASGNKKTIRLGLFGSVRQWFTLTRRYSRVLLRDKFNLFILLIQAPVIALLVFMVMGENQTRDFAYFALSLCAIWFGTSVGAREIVRERKIYERERMVNLGILPYLFSKYAVLGGIVALQCVLLFLPLKFFDVTGLMPMPGMFAGIPQFIALLFTAAVGITLGIFVSSIVKTSEMATSLIPLILIPQIIFSGLIGVPTGINKIVGLTMPATWSFDTIKRFSTLDTLEEEGSFDGKGLYKKIEAENEKIISDAKGDIRDYESKLEKDLKDTERRASNGERVSFSDLPERPAVGEAQKIPENLSSYITFLHPWMNEFLNLLVLSFMCFGLFIATVIALKIQDIM